MCRRFVLGRTLDDARPRDRGRPSMLGWALALALALTALAAAAAPAATVTLQPSPTEARSFATTAGS